MRLAVHMRALIIMMGLVAVGSHLHKGQPKGKGEFLPPRGSHNLPKHSGHAAEKVVNPIVDQGDLTMMASGDGPAQYATSAITTPSTTSTTAATTTTPVTTTPATTPPAPTTPTTTTPALNPCDPSSPPSATCEASGIPNDCHLFFCFGMGGFEGDCGPDDVWCQEQCKCAPLEDCPGACQPRLGAAQLETPFEIEA